MMERPTSVASLCVYLLGAFAATAHGEALATPSSGVQRLLGALLLHPRPWQRVQLAGTLFPDVPERRARQRLSHTLWKARQWAPALSLETTPNTVHLPPETVWLDVRVFREAAADEHIEAWLQALALYRGDLLEGIYDDWLLEEREAVYLCYVDLAHRVCDALWQQGRVETLLPIAERLVHSEPFDDRALRTSMRAYQALGRRGAALAAYEGYVSRLSDEMGIEPEPATQALAQAIRTTGALAGHPGADGSSDEAPGELLHGARVALVRGDAGYVEDCLTTLRAHPDCDEYALLLLTVDLALFVEDYARAAALLEDGDGAATTAARRLREAQLALGRHDAVAAQDLSVDVLMAVQEATAHDPETVDPEVEVEALLALACAQQQLGKGDHAARSIERALLRARACGFNHGVAQALLVDGQWCIYQGRYEGAHACFREACAVALEHGLRYDLARALRGLRAVFSHTNALDEALDMAQAELSLWRDMGLARWEAGALEGIATIQNHLGRSADSLRTLSQAQAISRRYGDPVRIATNQYNLASAMLYHDDALAEQAVEIARGALETFRAHNQPGWAAGALEIIGYALWVDGQHDGALDALREAEAVIRRLGELAFLPELLAYQGLARAGLGRADEALALTREAVALLAQGGVSDEVGPEILYAHAAALAANGREAEARRYFARAYSLLLDSAATFSEEVARQAFFHRNPTMRRLMRELRARGLAPPVGAGVRTVKLNAVRGRDSLHVEWTVDAGPADAALKRAKGAIALRQARLSRLLAEAHAQGGAPTVADLACALNVSPRTIQRDLAALRGLATLHD